MPNNYFAFKQFIIKHGKCAMKVGTDGVLLGAWSRVGQSSRILDIGTGTGLIVIMAAQRNPSAQITGIEIDKSAYEQAYENVQNSLWKDRIGLINNDILQWNSKEKFDCIISNPPYFAKSLKCPNDQRTTARHTDSLPYRDLLNKSYELLAQNGELSLITPFDILESIKTEAFYAGLHLSRVTLVHTKENAVPKRALTAFTKNKREAEISHLTLRNKDQTYTNEYKKLIKDFYIKI